MNISIWVPSIYVNPPKDILLNTQNKEVDTYFLIFQYNIDPNEQEGPLWILAFITISYECYAINNKIPLDHDDENCECDECQKNHKGYETI